MSQYVGQVIYVESLRYRAHWLDAHHSHVCGFTESPQSNVIDEVWAKWIVREGPDGTIALESLRYPNHYLDAHDSRTCRVTYSAYFNDDEWALWFLEDTPSGNVCFRSKRYPDSRLDSHHSGQPHVTEGSGEWSEMRIYQPDVSESKPCIFIYDNSKGTTPVETSYTEKTGISRTESQSKSTTITAEIGVEIKSIFSAKSSVSTTWQQSTSTTWTSEVTKTVKVTVNPGTVKKIYQLQGSYGPYNIASSQFFFEG